MRFLEITSQLNQESYLINDTHKNFANGPKYVFVGKPMHVGKKIK